MLGQTPSLPEGAQHTGLEASQFLNLPKQEADVDGGRPPKVINPIDVHVGTRIRLRRTLMGMSQERLGEALGVTFQQVQKYERGVNRVSAMRLYDLSRELDVPIAFFYDDMPESMGGVSRSPQRLHDFSVGQSGLGDDLLTRRETLELLRAYYRISDTGVRNRVVELIKSLAQEAPR